MIIKKLRLQRGWSQEHLAQCSGLSVRTIQRIERGHNAGLESLKSLAAVFEVELTTLQQENNMYTDNSQNTNQPSISVEEKQAMAYVQGLKEFYLHLIMFSTVMPILVAVNLVLTPNYQWFWWVLMGWGIGLCSHAIGTFDLINIFNSDWEKKQIEKRIGREL
ncbi:2TM domain-containing protein [Colwellia sp. MEBiC06753]